MYSAQRYLVHPLDEIRKDRIKAVSGGLPHSEIHGSKPVLGSPWLIAGYNVLHRLLVPRHPPIALSSLLYYKDARVHCEVLNIRAVTRADFNMKEVAGIGPREVLSVATEASGPNSVLGLQLYVSRGSTPLRVVLTRSADLRLNGQCSTFQSCSAPRRVLGQPRWTGRDLS